MALLIVLMLALGGWLDLGVLHLSGPGAGLPGLRFWLVAGAFAVAEAVVLHIELGRNTHSVSLAELTLTVSLFFLPAQQLPFARVAGGVVVLAAVRRQRPLKLVFNSSVWVLDVAIATLVFEQLGGSLTAGIARMVLPAALAALAAAGTDSLAVNAVIAATSHELDLARSLRLVRTCLVGALGCATAGLICVGALAFTPWLLIPILVVVGLFMYGFQHFAALRTRHLNVKALYDFAGELGRAPHGDEVVRTVLLRVGELLRAERATIYLHDPGSDSLLITTINEDGRPHERAGTACGLPPLILEALTGRTPVVVRSGSRVAGHAPFLSQYGVRDAVLAPFQGEQGLRGVLVIANRLGEVNTFSDDDGLLLQTLGSHAAAALANSRLVQQLNHDSLHDSLTGLANRAKFQQALAQALDAPGTGVAVLLMDLDRFKEVNDTLGHHHGDLLLQEIGTRLGDALRRRDLLARLGGDEFAVLMTDLTAAEAVATGERLLLALSKPMRLQGVEMQVKASIGVVHQARSEPASVSADPTVLMQRADVAMYAAKRHYTGVHLYAHELDGYSPRRLALAGGLGAAIEQRQLSLRYQPQLRMSDGAVVGAEALVRWEHPVYGEVAPDDFIDIAEQTGQIRELTAYVLDQALADCASWFAVGTDLAVSVNLSARNLMEPDLIAKVDALLGKHAVPGQRLTLEITESHLMTDPERTADVLRALASRGIRLSIDDFGTGYSSLAYLKQLPVIEVKVDKSFVRDLADHHDDAAIVEAIVQLAHTLHLEVVAEGVEDDRALALLSSLGCDIVQGYHLARPMPSAALMAWFATRSSDRQRPRLRALPAPRPDWQPAARPAAPVRG